MIREWLSSFTNQTHDSGSMGSCGRSEKRLLGAILIQIINKWEHSCKTHQPGIVMQLLHCCIINIDVITFASIRIFFHRSVNISRLPKAQSAPQEEACRLCTQHVCRGIVGSLGLYDPECFHKMWPEQIHKFLAGTQVLQLLVLVDRKSPLLFVYKLFETLKSQPVALSQGQAS